MRYRAAWNCRFLLVLSLACIALGSGVADASQSVYETDMEAFVRHVDTEYPFFSLKGIGSDWARAKEGLQQRGKDCQSDEQFLGIVCDAIRVLRDGHMGFRRSRTPVPAIPPRYYPRISFLPATNGRVVVMHAPEALARTLKTGTVVTKIDGTDARRYLEERAKAAWSRGGFFSSPQRARLFEYRLALRGDRGRTHTIAYRDDGKERALTLECSAVARGWPHTYNLPRDLTRVGRSFYYARLDDHVGYLYVRRVDASTPNGIDEALGAHPNLSGWIVDLRGNGGGGYDRRLIERIKRFPRPAAVLIDAGCVSAGETLARDFRALANARLFGSNSAGSSSAKRTWSFPSGMASIAFSVRSRWRSDKKPIEFNGIDPDVHVEAVPEELRQGKNSAILRAQQYIIRKAGQRRRGE